MIAAQVLVHFHRRQGRLCLSPGLLATPHPFACCYYYPFDIQDRGKLKDRKYDFSLISSKSRSNRNNTSYYSKLELWHGSDIPATTWKRRKPLSTISQSRACQYRCFVSQSIISEVKVVLTLITPRFRISFMMIDPDRSRSDPVQIFHFIEPYRI